MLWLLASESKDGSLDADPAELAFRLRTTEKEVLQGLDPLIKAGFFIPSQDASSVLADCGQLAVPETEREAETKGATQAFVLPDWIPPEAWAGYVEMRAKKKGGAMTGRARDLKIAELLKFKNAGHDVGTILDKSTANSWTDIYEPKGGATSAASQESFV
jgi:hypothetical protein